MAVIFRNLDSAVLLVSEQYISKAMLAMLNAVQESIPSAMWRHSASGLIRHPIPPGEPAQPRRIEAPLKTRARLQRGILHTHETTTTS